MWYEGIRSALKTQLLDRDLGRERNIQWANKTLRCMKEPCENLLVSKLMSLYHFKWNFMIQVSCMGGKCHSHKNRLLIKNLNIRHGTHAILLIHDGGPYYTKSIQTIVFAFGYYHKHRVSTYCWWQHTFW